MPGGQAPMASRTSWAQTTNNHLEWTCDKTVICTCTSQDWTATMSTRELDTTHPKLDDKNSPGLGGISTELGRHGQDQAMWSNVPCSSQPGKMQVSATPSTRPPSAAGEKQAPVLIARASGLDEANFRVASQSIRWNYPYSSKQSKSASRRDEDMWRCKHQALQASLTICWRAPGSPATVKSSEWRVMPCVHFQSDVRVHPRDNNQACKAWAGEPLRQRQGWRPRFT